ncbi:PREDICTED: uncharacterized protein LOC104613498 [Nelumbo nucifera]|uniref:DUF7734 domain-containing protein n=2 Tax=Nelumbo nucifera TaxID=4432 RepID=A0A822YY10_NELNU|nr:PREDICTED: uncharacterized protein LOC104613498 [Nelumbo nucifera]DAD37552.1 TPA_asm: hypothetical protein HUJ06_008193 [Nelumbo nucifera]
MLKQVGLTANLSSWPCLPFFSNKASSLHRGININPIEAFKLQSQRLQSIRCNSRRRVRYEDEDEVVDEEYGHNSEIAMLESYSESARNEALLVRAVVDNQEEEVLIFKGFSSCLSYRTSPNPSRSVLPARAVIKSIDRIKGPFNPANIEYIEKDLTWEAFKSRLQLN